jgi:hypothetical protein
MEQRNAERSKYPFNICNVHQRTDGEPASRIKVDGYRPTAVKLTDCFHETNHARVREERYRPD